MKRELSQSERDMVASAISHRIFAHLDIATMANKDKNKKVVETNHSMAEALRKVQRLFDDKGLKIYIETVDDGSYMADILRKDINSQS
jgi:hypothetical protein